MLGRAKFKNILTRSNSPLEPLLTEIRQMAEIITPPPLQQPVCRDPDDDEVLALAFAARADLIVSGDDDLLVLTNFEGIPIVTPAQAIIHIGAA